jgi:CheY-like chemotaxis protein
MTDMVGQLPLRVLVVEDHVEAADCLGQLVRLWGGSAEVAHAREDALRRADHYRPDVVLLDLDLGSGGDGCEVAEELRDWPAPYRPTLIAVTAHGALPDRRRSRAAGCVLHLDKPVEPDELREILKTVALAKGKALGGKVG